MMPQSLNKYAYVMNNPMKYVDPSGEVFYNPLSWDWGEIGSNALEATLDTLDAIPGSGDFSDLYAANTHTTLFSQDELSDAEYDLFAATAAAIPFVTAGQIKMIDGALDVAESINKNSGEIVDVYRVYGNKSGPYGSSWTPIDPSTVDDFRGTAGLPSVNSGQYVIEGSVKKSDISVIRPALELDGNKGGLVEYIIENAYEKIDIKNVSGANPSF